MIKVLIRKASDATYEEIKVFRSYKEFIEYLKKRYDSWIISFDYTGKYHIKALMYDSWIE